MKQTTIGQLRLEIRRALREFGVDDTLRHEAGIFMSGGISSAHRDRESSTMNGPPGLGGPEDTEQEERDEDEHAEKKSQAGARDFDRTGGWTGRPT